MLDSIALMVSLIGVVVCAYVALRGLALGARADAGRGTRGFARVVVGLASLFGLAVAGLGAYTVKQSVDAAEALRDARDSASAEHHALEVQEQAAQRAADADRVRAQQLHDPMMQPYQQLQPQAGAR